ncbi:acyl carrier protein [Kitasatospora sp. RB6PN24]|uniref:acyl carrier protein n=1 Tax=Kitasatospora humi TaxID=2893891 RepID=UPI001E457EFB|nr:acyl carrier protein [Kitasatospora humi]MCC9311442.1 acyl carrier protein [Kitasatospora humi]
MTDREVGVGVSGEDIERWLLERVSAYLETPVGEIDPEVSLAEYGLESVYAFALCGDIEDKLGVIVEPTVVWDVDTVAALTVHLVALMAELPLA